MTATIIVKCAEGVTALAAGRLFLAVDGFYFHDAMPIENNTINDDKKENVAGSEPPKTDMQHAASDNNAPIINMPVLIKDLLV